MHRVENAGYAAIAFHEPERLERERQLVLSDARKLPSDGPQSAEEFRAWSDALSQRLEAGGVLQDDILPPMTLIPS